jgi:hypothetical protein
MVNRRMKPAQVLTLIRKLARAKKLTVKELPGRGKGSHSIYALENSTGTEVARFGLTGHGSKDLSWTVMKALEGGLEHLFGEKWTEKR